MIQFELKGACVTLIEKLKKSMGQSNLLKLSIDIKLPRLYNDDPLLLTNPIEAFSMFLSQHIINGVINIDIQKWHELNNQITLQVNISASNVRPLSEEMLEKLKEEVTSNSLPFKNKYTDFHFEYGDNILSSSFKVTLSTPQRINEPSKALPFESKRILIAEDNEINAMVFSSFLDDWGCKNTIVTNGAEAVAYVKEKATDLILMDIYMPVLNGIEATREIREFNPTIPIIALTASTLETDIKNVWEAGINDIILKPVSSDNLFTTLRKFL